MEVFKQQGLFGSNSSKHLRQWDTAGAKRIHACISSGMSKVSCACGLPGLTVAKESAKLMSLFECEDIGPMEEYVGSKVEINSGKMKFKQPVLLQSFVDEFGVDAKCKVNLQAVLGQVLAKGEDHEIMDRVMRTKYRSGVGKLRYLATWLRPDISNAVREVSWHMQAPTKKHYEAMICAMAFCIATPERGQVIKPDCKWDRSREFEFQVSSKSDLTCNQCPETRKVCWGIRRN
jgi:hypothetical protein